MTNREYLDQKTSQEIGAWLDEPYQDKAPIIEKVKVDWSNFPNFKPEEFVCPCGKCELSKPEVVAEFMDPNVLYMAQTTRNKEGPTVITSGARCEEYNNSLPGAVLNSKHTKGKAIDFYIAGKTNTVSGRNRICNDLKPLPGYNYSYHNSNGKYPNMGSAIHVDVK